jgi:hypothetical protein
VCVLKRWTWWALASDCYQRCWYVPP